MTRRDFQLIADSVSRSRMAQGIGRKPAAVQEGERALRLVATDLAASLAHTNPRFDKARFLDACGFGRP